MRTTFDVRVWSVRERRLKTRVSWQVRWQVAGRSKANARDFSSQAAAESRLAEILTAVRRGEAFDLETGLPAREAHALRAAQAAEQSLAPRSWIEIARAFTDAKWDEDQAPGSRRSIAEALGPVTAVLVDAPVPATLADLVREALSGWTFNTGMRTTIARSGRRREKEPPAQWAAVLDWLERHSLPIADLADPDVTRTALRALSLRMDGRPAAANTVTRRRQVFGMALKYAVARGELEANPLATSDWGPPRKVVAIDRRVVVNPAQARRLFAAVAGRAPELEAFYATIYHAALRPGELQKLRRDQLTLPASGWGEVVVECNNPEISPRWSDTPDSPRQARQLKHRAKGEVRPVPLNPELVAILRRHLDAFGTTADGRLFRSGRDGPVKVARYREVWREAREAALTPAEAASPLARRPYDLRHAAVSGWLNAGVPVTQVAEWAGHSVRVLLMVYAKCIVGQDELARRRIDDALAAGNPTPTPGQEATMPPPDAPQPLVTGNSSAAVSTPCPRDAGESRSQPVTDGYEPPGADDPDLGGLWL
jgi:integrase